MKDEIDEELSEKRRDNELKSEGEGCDRHMESEGTGTEWCRHIND